MVAPSCVYVCGAEGTGKTTTTGRIARRYGLPALPETALQELEMRNVSFGHLIQTVDAINAFQVAVFDRQLALENATEAPYVADGHCLENLAYASENSLVLAGLAHSKRLAHDTAVMKRLQAGIVFFLRPHPSMMAQDGVRIGADYVAKQRIDAKIELLMQLWHVQFVSVESPSAVRRQEQIDYVLSAKGFKLV